MRVLGAVAAAALMAAASSAANATTTIDFNEFSANQFLGTSFVSQGYSFSNSGSLKTPINLVDADPTGRAIGNNVFATTTFVQKVGGGAFDLISMDFADRLNFGLSGPVIFDFSNGSSLTFSLDSAKGLQTLALNQLGVTSFSFRSALLSPLAGYYQFDNLVVDTPAAPTSAVPEPTTWAMLIVGFFGVGAVLRRSQRLTPAPRAA